jgi:hypothetical protein
MSEQCIQAKMAAKIFKVHFSESDGFFIIPDFRVPDL